MKPVDTALANFGDGFNCAQSVFSAYCEALNLDTQTAFKVAGGFGGGIGRLSATCGAVSGAVMLIGMKYGKYLHEDTEGRDRAYVRVREFAQQFEARHGSICCGELLGADFATNGEVAGKAAKERCPGFVQSAVELVGPILAL